MINNSTRHIYKSSRYTVIKEEKKKKKTLVASTLITSIAYFEDLVVQNTFSRYTCPEKAVLLFFLLTQAQKRVFSQLKALIAALVSKIKRTAVLGHVFRLINIHVSD